MKKNAAFEKFYDSGVTLSSNNKNALQQVFEAGQRASDPLRRLPKGCAYATKAYLKLEMGCVEPACYARSNADSKGWTFEGGGDYFCPKHSTTSAQRSRRHGK